MREIIKTLNDILRRQLDSQETLVGLSAEKRGAIILGDTERIDEIIKLELRELSRMNSAEKKRGAIMSALAETLNVPATATLREIIAVCDPDESVELARMQVGLTGAYTRLTELNAANKTLLEDRLEYTEAVLNLYAPAENPTLYRQGGRAVTGDASSSGRFEGSA